MGGQVLTEIEPIKSYLREMREGRAEGWAKGWAEGWAEGWARGWAEGWAEGRIHTLVNLVNKQMLSVEEAALEAEMSEEDFWKMLRCPSGEQE